LVYTVNYILLLILGTPEIKRLCEELVNNPSLKAKNIPIIVEKMEVFRESEVKYNLQFVLDMSYLINPQVVNYIKSGGAKNFECIVDQIRKDERKNLFDDAITKAGISKTEFDIYSINSVTKYLNIGHPTLDEIISNIKAIVEQRNNKKVKTILLLENEEIDLKQEVIAEELKQFWNNDSFVDAKTFVSSLVRKLHARKRKPNPIFMQEDTNVKKKSKKEIPFRKRKTNNDDEDYTEGKKRKTKSKSKKSKTDDLDEVDEMDE